jgi:hypothetical protein
MALQDLSLPIDIPWRLIATSNDMLASAANPFPFGMWRPSLAIFAYDPDLSDFPDTFSDRELSFLKVVASITSYAPPLEKGKTSAGALAVVDPGTGRSFPCSGALVQVSVYPKQPGGDDVTQLAYFTAMEPQKRELIEVVTESGESMTQSKSELNVRKGLTNTQSTEDLNVFTGMNVSAQGGGGVGASFGLSGQFGTIQRTTSEVVNQTTTDTSRDKRETASHTTNLSQLYHLLDSYHLGTNRAIFFLQSRPHTVQQKDRFTFINGPLEIEGVQEFFLVASRPRGVPLDEFCVNALLYTAHFDPEVLQAAINEPKTAETQWIDLWATARVLPQTTESHRSIGTIRPMPVPGLADTINYNNVISQDAATFEQTQTDFDSRIGTDPGDTIALIVNKNKNADTSGVRAANFPAVLDQTITTAVLRSAAHQGWQDFPEPGWRVDRTRGQGGYDLWEDPLNNSANSDADPRKPDQPQAFVDVLSVGSPLDPPNYFPDCGVRIRAMVWPGGSDTTASYHSRIKVYFIRNDLPAERSVPMFVGARGISTCPDSAVSSYVVPTAPGAKAADIVWEDMLAPAHVGPWTTPPPPPPPSPPPQPSTTSGAQQQPGPPRPVWAGSAVPSGDANAIGAARMKMANSIIDQVRRSLHTMLTTRPAPPMSFAQTDLFFKHAAARVLAAEMEKLTSAASSQTDLVRYVLAHAAAASIPVAAALGRSARLPIAQDQASPPAPTADFPALTLAHLSASERDALRAAGINSALDLLSPDAITLSRRLAITPTEARALRLQAIDVAQ